MARPSVLYVTDLSYPAKGRRYGDEDIFVTSRLRGRFDVVLCPPHHAARFVTDFDVTVVRNSGAVQGYAAEWAEFRRAAAAAAAKVFNSLDGTGDMAGKTYLVDLTEAGFPVTPTVARVADLGRLPRAERYVVKPVDGADSVGLRVIDHSELDALSDLAGSIAQPYVDFAYEVSFYFVGDEFVYALHAPDTSARWQLVPYAATDADLAFARRFVAWNPLSHGIQRVDACRTTDGDLLLVELEDLNPYLSLDAVDAGVRERFVALMGDAVDGLLAVT